MTDSDDDGEDKGVIRFPSVEEREKLEREKREREAQKERWRAAYRAEMQAGKAQSSARGAQPFFNLEKLPLGTRTFIFVFVLVHVVREFLLPASMAMQSIEWFSFVPAYYTSGGGLPWYAFLGPFTYAFLHGGWMHLLFNSIMMLAFGVFYERMFGARALALFFLGCSLGGALVFALMSPYAAVPVVGASGGLSGLFAAFLIYMHDQNAMPPIARKLTRYGVWPMLGFWFVFMVGIGMLMGDVAWQAHVGGFVSGIAIFQAQKKGLLKF